MQNRKLVALIGFGSAIAMAPVALADDHDDEEEIEFAVAEIFFELNNTDGDLGIHALIDGEPWKRLTIENPQEKRILNIAATSRLRRQGLTELFFESAEPTFDELAPRRFFRRFPEGTYEIEGITIDGLELESETEITHAMPAPADPTVNGLAMARVCDDEDPAYDAPTVVLPITISWPPVSTTHPTLGHPQSSPDITIVNYQLVVETELDGPDGSEFTTVFSTIVPPDVTSVTVPAEFLAQSDEFKYEVLAREESWNQTATESCFLIAD